MTSCQPNWCWASEEREAPWSLSGFSERHQQSDQWSVRVMWVIILSDAAKHKCLTTNTFWGSCESMILIQSRAMRHEVIPWSAVSQAGCHGLTKAWHSDTHQLPLAFPGADNYNLLRTFTPASPARLLLAAHFKQSFVNCLPSNWQTFIRGMDLLQLNGCAAGHFCLEFLSELSHSVRGKYFAVTSFTVRGQKKQTF